MPVQAKPYLKTAQFQSPKYKRGRTAGLLNAIVNFLLNFCGKFKIKFFLNRSNRLNYFSLI